MAHRPSCRSCRHCAQPIGAQPIGAQPIGAQPSGAQPIGAPPSGAQLIGALSTSGAQVGFGGRAGWCQMRQLTIPAELSGELWCPHWTARSPRLPLTSQTAKTAGVGVPLDQQLSLSGMFEAMELEPLAGLPLAE